MNSLSVCFEYKDKGCEENGPEPKLIIVEPGDVEMGEPTNRQSSCCS